MMNAEMDFKDMWMDLKGLYLKEGKTDEILRMEEMEQTAWEDACIRRDKAVDAFKNQVVVHG